MPFTGPTSYLPTIERFSAHWEAVDAELGAQGPLTLAGGFTIGDLKGQHDELDAFFTEVQGGRNAREIARALIESGKNKVLARAQEFGRQMRGPYAQSPFREAMPNLPPTNVGQGRFLQPMQEVAALWAAFDESPEGPLVFPDGYSRTGFESDFAALSEQYNRYRQAEIGLKIVRARRNGLMANIRRELGGYRPTVEALLPPAGALGTTIPRMTPQPGSTPAPVSSEARWDGAAEEMVVTFDESRNAKLKGYEVRAVMGGHYRNEDEVVLAAIAPGAPRELRSSQNLTRPGATVAVKAYVLLTTGNEAGSKAVVITRPLETGAAPDVS